VGLARGYFNDPVQTADRFVPNPFSGDQAGRLYRTGDLAYYLPQGNLQFLGRMDRQVKVRGFRIELGEIESALSNHESIRECVVIARDTRQNDKEIVAFTVCADNVSSLSLRQFLRETLPDHMIPSKFVALDAIPLTSNRKTDYKALFSMKEGSKEDRADYVPPQSSMEISVADIWKDVLGVEKVGVHDNFFDLGGHSLMVIRVISKIEDRLKIKMTFRDFINQTLGQFASSCEAQVAMNTK
jgi:acyl carrier protein